MIVGLSAGFLFAIAFVQAAGSTGDWQRAWDTAAANFLSNLEGIWYKAQKLWDSTETVKMFDLNSEMSTPDSPDPNDPKNKRNWENIKGKYLEKRLKEQNTDPHKLKQEYLGKRAKISRYDIKVDKLTGQLGIFDKQGNLVEVTSYFIK